MPSSYEHFKDLYLIYWHFIRVAEPIRSLNMPHLTSTLAGGLIKSINNWRPLCQPGISNNSYVKQYYVGSMREGDLWRQCKINFVYNWYIMAMFKGNVAELRRGSFGKLVWLIITRIMTWGETFYITCWFFIINISIFAPPSIKNYINRYILSEKIFGKHLTFRKKSSLKMKYSKLFLK